MIIESKSGKYFLNAAEQASAAGVPDFAPGNTWNLDLPEVNVEDEKPKKVKKPFDWGGLLSGISGSGLLGGTTTPTNQQTYLPPPKNNKPIIIAAIAAGVLILGGGTYMILKNK